MHTSLPYILYLGSTSRSRQMLLQEAGIPFTVVGQSADESKCDWGLPLAQAVEGIARYKMEHVQLPSVEQGTRAFVLTADTLTENAAGKLEGKPVDRADAIAKLIAARAGVRTGTACVLEQRVFNNGSWQTEKQVVIYAEATYQFNVADAWLDYYIDNAAVLGAGAIAIEGFGNQFLQTLNGSLSAVIGLPMYEVRQELERMGFYSTPQ
jgi:septum formation protein